MGRKHTKNTHTMIVAPSHTTMKLPPRYRPLSQPLSSLYREPPDESDLLYAPCSVFCFVFIKGMVPIICVFLSPLKVQKVKSASNQVVLAPWRSDPVETFYSPLEVSSSPLLLFVLVFVKGMFTPSRRERDPSTPHPCTTAPSIRHSSRGSASTVAYAGSASVTPPYLTHPGREAYPDRKKQGTHRLAAAEH